MEEIFSFHHSSSIQFPKEWPYVLKLLLLSVRHKIFVKSLSSYPKTSHSSPEDNLELGIKKKSEDEELGLGTGTQPCFFCSI